MSRSIRLTSILLGALVFQGCVGLGVVSSKRSERKLSDVLSGFTQPTSIQGVVKRWGGPDEIRLTDDGAEVWVYDSGLRWAGLVFCVLIPIPLLVPVGREDTSLTVRDGRVVSATRMASSTTLYVAGLVPGICTDLGVGVFYR